MKMRFILATASILAALMFSVNGCGGDNSAGPSYEYDTIVHKRPWIIYQRDGNVAIFIETDKSSQVQIYTTPSNTRNVHFTHTWDIKDAGDDRTLHWFEVSEIKPDTHYDYEVHVSGDIYHGSFHTAPDSDKVTAQLKFFGYGDTKSDASDADSDNNHDLRTIAAEMNAYSTGSRETAFIIHTGDIVPYGGEQIHWSFDKGRVVDTWKDNFFVFDEVASLLKRKGIFTSVGNHEFSVMDDKKETPSTYNYWKHFPYHEYEGRVNDDSYKDQDMYYKFDWGPAEFFCLTTYPIEDYCGTLKNFETQLEWLKTNLANTEGSDRQWKIVFLHVPARSPECSQSQLKNYFIPVFEKYGVDMVLQGHEHYYSRITVPGPFGNPNGIPYLVLGGGGAGLSDFGNNPQAFEKTIKKHHYGYFEINGDMLTTRILDIHSQPLDTFVVDRTPIANFEANQTADICQFKSMSTGNIVQMKWSFPDGTTSSDQDINKSCEDMAPGTIKLTAQSAFNSNTAVMETNSSKLLNISFASDKTTGKIGSMIMFKPVDTVDSKSDSWQIGDFEFDVGSLPPDGFGWMFDKNGKFDIKRTVLDNEGNMNSIVLKEFICIEPYGRFTFLPQEGGKTDEAIRFYNESAGDGLTYAWNFGDGSSTSADQHPTHTYATTGTYTVKLDITDENGLTDSYERNVTIVNAE